MEKKQVAQYIAHEHLLEPDGKVIVALSGGADSVALLLLLGELGYTCEAAHCNFHLRGEESDRDERFVRHLCEERHIPLHVVHFDTARHAAGQHVSIEMAARELRYTWFEELRRKLDAQAIAVAHHADDSIETFLLNLMRGTGINGLRGIRPRNGHIVRPLLCLNREDILRYLEHCGQTYVTDSTNLQDEYTRNKIRLNLLPLMQEINPSVRQAFLRTAAHLDEAATLYNIGIAEAKERVLLPEGIRIDALLEEADEIRFEIDDAVTLQEPLPIYLFADGVMVQVTLLEKEKAYVEVHNPNYRYEDQMEMAQGTRSVMAAESRTDGKKGVPIRSYLVYGAVVFLWGLMFYHLVYKHRFLLHKKKGR